MTGDQDDLIARLHRWLPTGWFPTEVGTRIHAVLSGMASLFGVIHSSATYLQLQTRLATTTDGFLDIAARDFFGPKLPRLEGEPDATFSLRIRREILRERLTRNAIDTLLFEITGDHPEIVELERPNDVFCWRGRSGWRTRHLGSRSGRYTVFIRTIHAGSFGIGLGGYRTPRAAWRVPTFVYGHPTMVHGSGYTDEQILNALDSIRPAGVTYFVKFQAAQYLGTETGALLVTDDGLSILV